MNYETAEYLNSAIEEVFLKGETRFDNENVGYLADALESMKSMTLADLKRFCIDRGERLGCNSCNECKYRNVICFKAACAWPDEKIARCTTFDSCDKCDLDCKHEPVETNLKKKYELALESNNLHWAEALRLSKAHVDELTDRNEVLEKEAAVMKHVIENYEAMIKSESGSDEIARLKHKVETYLAMAESLEAENAKLREIIRVVEFSLGRRLHEW